MKKLIVLLCCWSLLILGGCAPKNNELPSQNSTTSHEDTIPQNPSASLENEPNLEPDLGNDPVQPNTPGTENNQQPVPTEPNSSEGNNTQQGETNPAGPDFSQGQSTQPTDIVSGIVAMTVDLTSNVTIDINAINPISGAQTQIAYFDLKLIDGTTDNSLYLPLASYDYSRDLPGTLRFWVSEDFTKLRMLKISPAPGEQHAGWVDETGAFFDVTVATGLQAKNDFEKTPKCQPIGFIGDQYLFLATYDDAEKIYAVPIDDVSPSSLQETTLLDTLLPDTGAYYRITDQIDETHYLVNDCPRTSVEDPANVLIYDTLNNTFTTYIPGDVRYNWNGILSPDKTMMAFISAPKEGTDWPAIYVTSTTTDLTPTKLLSITTFTRSPKVDSPNFTQLPINNTVTTMLIDWY